MQVGSLVAQVCQKALKCSLSLSKEVIAMSSRTSSRSRVWSTVSAGLIVALVGGSAFGGARMANAQAASAKPAAAAAAAAKPATAKIAKKAPKSSVHTRKEIHSLTATEITNYR